MNYVLRKGDKGQEIKRLQSKLSIKIDGDFGPITEKAVKDFQSLKSLTIDGIAGPITLSALGMSVIFGVDLSRHNGDVDFVKLSKSGCKFAWIKLTEGTDHVNPGFVEKFKGCRDNGIVVGAYHFGRPDTNAHDPRDASNESKNFLDALNQVGLNSGDLLPVLDLEAGMKTDDQFNIDWALNWLEENEFDPIKFEPATNEKTMTEEIQKVERAEPDGLKVGDFVSWNSSGGRARGKIDRIIRDGSIDVPDSSFTITGTADDPAALITLYRNGEATDRKVGHKFSTLTKIAAIRTIDSDDKLERKEVTDFKNVKARTFEFPFSSEFPVKRYFGNEILSHEEGAADLSRLNDGGIVLFNHDMNKPIGVVESARIDSETKRGYAKIRFSRNPFRFQSEPHQNHTS